MSSDEDDSYGEPTKAEFDEYQRNFSKTGILHVTVDAIEAGDSDTLTFGRWRGGNPRWIIYSRETKHSAERNPFYGKLIHGDIIINLNDRVKFSSTTKWEYDEFKYMMELATMHESTWTIFRPFEYSVIVAKDDRCWEDGLPFEYSAETREITMVYHGSETRGNKNLWDLLLKMSIGDIITKIDGTPVTLYSSEELIEAMNKTKGDFVLHLQKASKGASCDKDRLEELEDKVTELENEILVREYDDTNKDEILHLTEKIMVLEKENDELRRSLTNYLGGALPIIIANVLLEAEATTAAMKKMMLEAEAMIMVLMTLSLKTKRNWNILVLKMKRNWNILVLVIVRLLAPVLVLE